MVRQDKGGAEERTKESSQPARRHIGKSARWPGRGRVVGDCNFPYESEKEIAGEEVTKSARRGEQNGPSRTRVTMKRVLSCRKTRFAPYAKPEKALSLKADDIDRAQFLVAARPCRQLPPVWGAASTGPLARARDSLTPILWYTRSLSKIKRNTRQEWPTATLKPLCVTSRQ
jgi:hypothetical protein